LNFPRRARTSASTAILPPVSSTPPERPGTSKGAVLTHNNFAINAINITACWQISSADRLLLALPLFHVHGLGNGLHAWLVTGCRLRLLERFDHQQAAQEFLDFHTTLFFGVPAMYVRMNDWPQ